MSDKKIKVPDGMLEAAIDSHNEAILRGETPLVYKALEAALRWQAENWNKAPNAERMPDQWYYKSLKKWEKFSAQWRCREDISFVDLLIFFGNRLNERFLAPEPAIEPCCERDTDGDGNCQIHSSKGVFRNSEFNKSSISAESIYRIEGRMPETPHDSQRVILTDLPLHNGSIPEEIKEFLVEELPFTGPYADVHNYQVIEAFRRGQKEGK
jgi:hypothetical protein